MPLAARCGRATSNLIHLLLVTIQSRPYDFLEPPPRILAKPTREGETTASSW